MSTRLEATAQERKEDLAERKGSPGELHSMGEGVGGLHKKRMTE